MKKLTTGFLAFALVAASVFAFATVKSNAEKKVLVSHYWYKVDANNLVTADLGLYDDANIITVQGCASNVLTPCARGFDTPQSFEIGDEISSSPHTATRTN